MLSEEQMIGLYHEHQRPLYAFVSRRVGGDRTLAEDIVQDTWMRAVEHWPDKGAPDRPIAWLMRVARNLVVSHFRRKRPQPVDVDELRLEDDRFRADTPEAEALVHWGLARVRRGHAELLEDFHLVGKTVAEIAAERGLSERAVEGRLRRGRKSLRRKLRRHLVAGGAEPARDSAATAASSEHR